MKKIFIIALAIATTGVVSSCSKDNSVTPTTVKTQKTTVADKSDVGGGDLTPPTTPPPPPPAGPASN